MIKRYIAVALGHLRLVIAGLLALVALPSCAAGESRKPFIPWAQSEREREIGDRIDEIWERFIHEVLYVGMPEEEFVQLFTKSSSWKDPDRPYIIEREEHRYIFLQAPRYGKDQGRVTFVNGALSKYEQFGLGQNPFGYTDCTFLLRPAKGVPARWE